ncbi:MAG: L-arabinose isomerase [Saprospiraceae bacterium]|nr:L-arabinose isomerase [Saprospiraceae bacterium]
MIDLNAYEVWFITGSQHLYGDEVLQQVESNARELVGHLNAQAGIEIDIQYRTVLTTQEDVVRCLMDAEHTTHCIGCIAWMHTFSPAKMWINGLMKLRKPLLHLHTQYHRDIPWKEIDMQYMNLHQSAHGDREFGFLTTRMGIPSKVVAGHWSDKELIREVGIWSKTAAAWHDSQSMKIARFGDNMREVAVTEGDKVAAQMKFGYSVNGYGLGDLVESIQSVDEVHVTHLLEEYESSYILQEGLNKDGMQRGNLKEAARIEIGLETFLRNGNFTAFTDTFENLYGLTQLPGIAVQRLMQRGYGFAAEGDWKTAALVRSMKVMAAGLKGGTSFMEDYTYHLDPQQSAILGSHMLEICPSISGGPIRCEAHPLAIGGKDDPVRLIFEAAPGPAINASIVDLGDRFRLVLNQVETIAGWEAMPALPVAYALWKPEPDLTTAATCWLLAGGAHHTGYSSALSMSFLEDFAEMANIECLVIDRHTNVRQLKQNMRANASYY